MSEQTLRSEMLLGSDALVRLRRSRVAVLGLGGVGSWCAEALARAGVGALTLVDEDTVSESNINRQCCALHSTIGLPKAEVMAARVILTPASPSTRAPSAMKRRHGSGFSTQSMIILPIASTWCPVRWI